MFSPPSALLVLLTPLLALPLPTHHGHIRIPNSPSSRAMELHEHMHAHATLLPSQIPPLLPVYAADRRSAPPPSFHFGRRYPRYNPRSDFPFPWSSAFLIGRLVDFPGREYSHSVPVRFPVVREAHLEIPYLFLLTDFECGTRNLTGYTSFSSATCEK